MLKWIIRRQTHRKEGRIEEKENMTEQNTAQHDKQTNR